MNMLNLKTIALGAALAGTTMAASAQKSYTKGTAIYDVAVPSMNITASPKVYFTPDTSALERSQGPATITVVVTSNGEYSAILVNIPVAQRKLAAVMTPGEIEEEADKRANYTFTATTETKKIGEYNCTKYTAKEAKTNGTYDVWITKDLTLPANILTLPFKDLPGTPIDFPVISPNPMDGKFIIQAAKLSSVSADKPANVFTITSDYTKISYSDLMSMGGRK